MKQHDVDEYVNSADNNCYEIIEKIKEKNPETKIELFKIIKKNKDPVTPFILNYIDKKYDTIDNENICEIIEEIYMDFRDNMMKNLEMYGLTPRGFKISSKKWKKNIFDNY